MKKMLFLSITFFWLITSIFCQKPTMELSFAAKYDGQFVSLDSILIMNLTKDTDTTLYAHDTVLALDYFLNIHDNISTIKNNFSVSQNFPNPFTDLTTINIKLNEEKEIKIDIYDINGRKVGHYQSFLNRGSHSFSITPGDEKVYLLTASVENDSKTIKILNTNSKTAHIGMCEINYKGLIENSTSLKSQTNIKSFMFSPGDHLRYIGYAKTLFDATGSDIITDSPENSQTYPFEIREGIPCNGVPTIVYAGKVYNTVLIGEQCWMKENLDIGYRIDDSVLVSDNGVIEKYCYDDNLSNCDLYGALYHWKEMMLHNTDQGIQGICPDGWHLPTDIEWTELVSYLGGEKIAGGKLKEKSTIYWSSPNTGATNESGFFALPGGGRYNHGSYITLGLHSVFWSSSQDRVSDASLWKLEFNNSKFSKAVTVKSNCYSVRCIMD